MKKFNKALVIFTLLSLFFGSAGCLKDKKSSPTVDSATNEALSPQLRIETISPQSRSDLHRYFFEYQYSWNTLKHGVPPLIVEKFPDDFYELAAGSERTKTFFLTLLPMVLLVNEEITVERNNLLEIFSNYDSHQQLSIVEIEKVIASARSYKVNGDPLTSSMARTILLNRLNIIPPSLALAQAASESAYGTSRFSRLGNNLFGEMVFNSSSAGIMPLNRPEGAKHRARIFPTLLDSLRAYVLNLNTHPAYQELRQIRAEISTRGEKVLGLDLVKGLLLYSTRKEAYIDDIRSIMRANNLPRITAEISLRHEDFRPDNQLEISSQGSAESPPQASIQNYDGRYLLSQN